MRLVAEFVLWALCRMVAVATLALPYGYYIPSDLTRFGEWADQLAGGATITGDTWQYPPGVALLLGLVGELGGGTAMLITVILAADLAVLLLLRGSGGAILWAISPLFVGPIMLTRLETLVTLTAILGLVAHRVHAAGAWLGLGASLKLWPGVLTLVSRSGSPTRLVSAVAAYGVVAAISVAAFHAPAFLGNQARRGLQVESAAAWPFMAARSLGAPIDLVSRNGSTEVDSPLADAIATALLPVSLLLAGGLAVWGWRLRRDCIHTRASVSILVVLALLLTSRVLSPQFVVWVIGLLALGLSRGPMPARLTLSVLGSALLGQILYPFVYVNFLEGGVPGLLIQSARLALLCFAFWFTWTLLRRLEHAEDPADGPVPVGSHEGHAA